MDAVGTQSTSWLRQKTTALRSHNFSRSPISVRSFWYSPPRGNQETFSRKMSLFDKQAKHWIQEEFVRSYVWNIPRYSSETWTLRKLERKYMERFEMWCWRRMGKIKWSEKDTDEQVLERIGKKRTLLNNIQLDWSYCEKKLPPSWCHWRANDGSERSRKKNTAPWWFEKEKKILEAKRGSWRSKKMETILYKSNIRRNPYL